MRFRTSAPAILIIAVAIVIAAISLLAQLSTHRLVAVAHAGDYELMSHAFSSTLKAMEDEAASDAELFANMPAVRGAFAAKDRDKLFAECRESYRMMEEKYAIDQAQFHLPPGVSFLRLGTPEKFGDEQASYRPMLAEVHEEKSLRKGIDITRLGPAIFGITPVYDAAGTFLGSFEMGLEFGPVLDELKQNFSLEGAVFFEEKQLQQISTELPADMISPKNRVGKYIRYHATHTELTAALVSDKDVEITTAKTYERTVAGVPWGVQLIPLYNYAHKQIGVVAIAASFDEDKTLATRALIWQVLAGLIGVVLLAGLVLVVLRGTLLRPLAVLSERMTALAAGDTSQPVDAPEHFCEEMTSLAQSYEKLRERVKSESTGT